MNEIKALRKRLGLTQFEFARRLGVVPQSVRRWESGRGNPSPMARRLLEELNKEGK